MCPVVRYILHLIQIKWIDSSSYCIVHAVRFLLTAIFFTPPLPMVLFPLIFFSVMGAYLLPFLWGLMDGLRCCASHKGGGGSVY